MKKLIFLFFILIFNCSSNDEMDLNADNYLIFGHFYGFCVGESCVETFKLTNENLFEDTNDDYLGTSVFNFEELDNNTFEQVKDLIDFFPTQLLSEKENVIGCPDCADGGGVFIKYSKKGIINSWRIDQVKSNVPTYLHGFMDKINEKISLINN